LTESLLPPPTEVFVSPLQRALQTADLIFPDHSNIIVREELRERMTGRPADNRMASHLSEKQFRRFSFVRLRLNSFFEIKSMHPFRKKDGLEDCDDEDNDQDESMPKPSPINTKRLVSMESSFNSEVREDEAKLRQRTMKIFELLTHSQHDSVAIVTHKGYLRGLERGALGQPDATEFQNCEVRVYKVTFSPGTKILDHVERLR
jgi:broad specificity phosphatase PhoE